MMELSDAEKMVSIVAGILLSGTGIMTLTLGVVFILRAAGVIE